MCSTDRYAVGGIEHLGEDFASIPHLARRTPSREIFGAVLGDCRGEYADVKFRRDVRGGVANFHVNAIFLKPSRARRGMQIAARYGVSGFLKQIGDAGHAYTAYASEMISFCHRITGRRIAVSETVTDLDANE